MMKLVDGVEIEMTPEEEAEFLATSPVVVPPPAITYKGDIWRRATDAEAQTIDAQINAQTVRERNLFRDALYLDHSDPYFEAVKAGFIAAFGKDRADDLLAPSE